MLLQEERERERKRKKKKPRNKNRAMLTNPSPPTPLPPSQPLSDSPVPPGGSDGHSGGPSLLIIVGIIAFVIAASASIHLILRLISRSRSSSSSSTSSSSPPSPTPLLRSLSSAGNGTEPQPQLSSDREQLISSLPLFSLASSVASFRKSASLDCAVCLSNFHPQDELRLLPACRHAFHSQCVDTWLRSTPSCPLCRASIHLPPLPPQVVNATGTAPSIDSSRSGSFRVELGSVSRRAESTDGIPAPLGRSYSLGSSFEYLVDEEVEAVLDFLRRAPEGKRENGGEREPPAPASQFIEAAAGGGRGWLRDCVDRLTSSSSSSFNSLRFSGRNGSHRFDPSRAVTGGGGRTWDFEANNFMDWEEESGFAMFYRWLVGV